MNEEITIKEATIEELEFALELRKRKRDAAERPKQLGEEADDYDLRNACAEYIDFVGSDEYHEDNDYEAFIFEAAVITYYGPKVFDWVNKKIEQHYE